MKTNDVLARISLRIDEMLPPKSFYTLHLFNRDDCSLIAEYTSHCDLRNMAKALRKTAGRLDKRAAIAHATEGETRDLDHH